MSCRRPQNGLKGKVVENRAKKALCIDCAIRIGSYSPLLIDTRMRVLQMNWF